MLKCRVIIDTVINKLAASMDCRVKSGNDVGAIETAAPADYLRSDSLRGEFGNGVAQG
jgi:hypothetical protein